MPSGSSSSSDRLRLWLERGESGYWLRDAATGDAVRWDDERLRVVKLAGASYRMEALQDDAFAPGRRLALVREPDNEHDPNAVAVWDAERRVQAGYVPAEVAPELSGDERRSRSGSSAARTGSASASGCWWRPRMHGFRSRARERNQVSTWLQSLHRHARPDDCNLLESRLLAVIHEIPLEEATLHGYFSSVLSPVLSVDPGDSVRFQSLNAGWRWDQDSDYVERDAELHNGHALAGPVDVRGAKAGQTLVVSIDEVTPRNWGVTFGDGTPFHWTIDGDVATDERGKTVSLAPFMGVIGMPPPQPGIHSTGPPRKWGGNIDCKLLVAGTTLYLPIPLDGAVFSAGDGHAAQGDGEVSGTAIECPLERAQVTLDLSDLELRSPIARIDGAWVAFGFDEDLDLAAEQSIATMLDLMERELELDRSHALALSSVVVDLHVTQIVNGTKGVHAILRDDAIR